MKHHALLAKLADGQIHSGESLAAELGVSRTAIWKQLKRAQADGYRIETIKGKGYRLTDQLDPVLADELVARLPEALRARCQLDVLDTVASTNTLIAQRGPAAGNEVLVCLANEQTAGRGRRGRVWQSPGGENIYLSLGLGITGGFQALDGLSLVVGCAIAGALAQLQVPDVALKWPNDVLVEGRKLAGVLIELNGELEGRVNVVIGVGLNVHMRVAPGVDQPWTSLATLLPGASWRRVDVAAALIAHIVAAMDTFTRQGFGVFRDGWQQRDALYGRELVTVPGGETGRGAGIDESGSYLLQADEGLRVIRAGELSLRVAV
ncbi:MAG: biotin--[acetyl-CoA-carboxylase] ligase [Marinobacter sp.]|nr:biotin--[acetyl-CoA-carboxylase] ligase [Marinobacter sp.]